MYQDVIIAGFGGQGVLLIGNLLAQAGMEKGMNVTFLPVYGAEMRGGTANCTVVLSDDPIGPPLVEAPMALIAMNAPSLEKFQPKLKAGGVQIVNASLIEQSAVDSALRTVYLPMNEIADEQAKNPKLVNMVALGALLKATNCLSMEAVKAALKNTISSHYAHLIPQNEFALDLGYNFQ